MEGVNQTLQVSEFLFLGFFGMPRGQPFFFLLFLTIYLITLVANSMILILIQMDSRLHSPMYYFLSHLSCLDICYSSVTVPKILVNLLRLQPTISYNECMAQMFFLITCTGSECTLLAVMAYDRYAAICEPLHYSQLMSREVRVPMATASWILGLVNSTLHTALTTNLIFCRATGVHHIFCDVPPLLKIACSDTYGNETALHIATIFVGLCPFLLVIISYIYILSTILKIRSNTGRRKTFPTCGAHLVTVIVYFGMGILNYNRPSAGYSLGVDTLVSTLYCIVTPMLNPLIYSLRNKEVKGALQKLLSIQEKEDASLGKH
ncbi:olfactory receptor 5T17-like [Erythrolamprus reginae]|uniref:olfactory receptor 5T17-like n=1 Tax=Erythrolamprus reginae TaxID=121349 RepID=UPI00396D035A